jgi:hypothetical protein
MKGGETMKYICDKVTIDSVRSKDANGFLHVAVSNLTKEQIAPYLGSSIPNWQSLDLDPNKMYQIYRPADEIEKSAETFNGLPVMLNHWNFDANTIGEVKDKVVGSLGTDARWEAPYLKNSLIITDADAIAKIEDGSYSELSASYLCDVDMTGGIWQGKTYDGIMTGIIGNHVALVPEGRAGHDVRIADISIKGGKKMDKWEKLVALLKEVFSESEETKDEQEVEVIEKTDMNEAPAPAEEVEVKEETKDEEEPVDVEADKIRELMTKAGLDPEDDNEQKAFLAGMALGKESMEDACKDGDAEVEVVEKAADSIADAKEHFASLYKAAVEVEPIVGRIKNPMAFDSASDIYKKALVKRGIKLDGIEPVAYAGMVAVLKSKKSAPVADGIDNDDPLNKVLMNIKSV